MCVILAACVAPETIIRCARRFSGGVHLWPRRTIIGSNTSYFLASLCGADSDGSEHGQQRAPKRQGRREIMLDFFQGLILGHQPNYKLIRLTCDALARSLFLREAPCTLLPATQSVSLPSFTYQVGHHEKNVNQCDSARRVAYGNGRRPTPL